MAVNDLGLLPSEVRTMTIGEINAVIWARTRTSDTTDHYAELYDDLMRFKNG